MRAFLARRRRRRRGLAIVISDFYDPAGHRAALDLLRHHRLEVVADPGERARRSWRPTCAATSSCATSRPARSRELTVSPAVLAAYRQRHQTLLRDLEGYCRERAIPCFTVVSDQAFDAVVLRMFRAGGLLALSARHEPRVDLALLSGPLPARAAAIAGAVGAVAITVLYLVRLRRRRVVVSFAPLWLDAAGPRRTTSWARRLRDLLSLLLALALLGLVLLAAVDPRPAAADRAGRSLVHADRSLGVDVGARRQPGHAAGRRAARARDRDRRRADRRGPRADRVVRGRRRGRDRVRGRRRPAAPRGRAPSRPARSRAICRAR